ncbi:MAG: porin family protein [Thermoanaerobaculia bacterium]|nr:porin family protein [Thermoanaerobaculia bacterium]
MCRSFVFSAFVCAALALASPAFAQDRSGTFELSPFGGAYFGGNLYDGSLGRIHAETDFAYGVRFAYNVSRHFGIEVDWTEARPRLHTDSHHAPYTSSTVGHLRHDVYEANGIFNFGTGRVYGYIGLGAGASVLKTELNAGPSDTQTKFTGNFSAGMKAFVTPRFGFRLDGRLRSTDTDQTTNHGTTCDFYGYCYHYHSNWYYSSELTGGLIFAF